MKKTILASLLAALGFFSMFGGVSAATITARNSILDPQSIRNEMEKRIADQKQEILRQLCVKLSRLKEKIPSLTLPSYCRPTPPPAPTLDLTATPNTVQVGENSTLSWSSTNATLCVASDGWLGQKNLSGNEIVTVSATTTYSLTCGNIAATTTKSVTINATPIPPPEPTLDFSATPATIIQGATSTLNWSAGSANTCTASNGWSGSKALAGSLDVSPTATTTYTLLCEGDGGNISKNATVNIVIPPTEEPPAQTIGHVVISEVYYDVSSTTGEDDPENEWVELYNGTNAFVDISGWKIFDGSATDTIPTLSPIPAGGFVLITDKASTTNFWTIPSEVQIVILGSPIGNGLSNTGDAVYLKNGDSVVDEVNYGTNVSVMNPAVPNAPDGQSITREQLTADTDTADDWTISTTPTPGAL